MAKAKLIDVPAVYKVKDGVPKRVLAFLWAKDQYPLNTARFPAATADNPTQTVVVDGKRYLLKQVEATPIDLPERGPDLQACVFSAKVGAEIPLDGGASQAGQTRARSRGIIGGAGEIEITITNQGGETPTDGVVPADEGPVP